MNNLETEDYHVSSILPNGSETRHISERRENKAKALTVNKLASLQGIRVCPTTFPSGLKSKKVWISLYPGNLIIPTLKLYPKKVV